MLTSRDLRGVLLLCRDAGQFPAQLAAVHASQDLALGDDIAGLDKALLKLAGMRRGDKAADIGLQFALHADVVRHGNTEHGRNGNGSRQDRQSANFRHCPSDAPRGPPHEPAFGLFEKLQSSRDG